MPASLVFNPGDIIGNNIIIEKDTLLTKEKHKSYWKCKCIYCGEIRSVRADSFKYKCKSCGNKYRSKENYVKDDLTDKNFGYWTVIKKSSKSNYWTCQCKCGTIKDIFRGNLIQGTYKSCGCVSSWGETQISYLLNLYQINYKKEYYFQNFKTDKNKCPRFDFALFDKNEELYCLIEFDGRQHYYYDENWKMSEEDFKRLQYIDNLKTDYCKEHNILLYRFNKDSNLEKEIKDISYGRL